MFLDSNIIRPLYDVHEGGKPKAFMCVCKTPGAGLTGKEVTCGMVSNNLKTIINHVMEFHGEIQLQLFPEIKPTRE